MLSRLRHLSIVALLLAAAVAQSGCGSSASPAATAPKGFVVYHASGFSLSVPKGFQAHTDTVSGAPPGSETTRLTPAGQSLNQANTDILLTHDGHAPYPLQQIAANLRKADLGDPQLSQVRVSVSEATVTGAKSALLVRDSYNSPYSTSGSARGQFNRTWLMIETKAGGLIDVVVVVEPQRGARLNPGTVIGSVRLSG